MTAPMTPREALLERLRNPMWVHSSLPFEGPQLERDENIAAMKEAADEIEHLTVAPPAPCAWQAEMERLRDFARWVDTWVSNPVGSYSVSALDGLFGMTRDRLAALPSERKEAKDLATRWPLGCHSPNSCSRNGRCMYIGCQHEGKDIKALATAFTERKDSQP